MRLKLQQHGHECDCSGHRAAAKKTDGAAVEKTDGAAVKKTERGSLWASLLPVLACAVCPACLTTYAKVLSVFGIGFGLSELQHLVLLVIAISASVAVSAWRSWRSRRSWPLAIALTGSTLVLIGHFAGDLHAVEWAGVVVLLLGGLSEQFRLMRAPAAAHAQP